jgi:hypothetical protein
LIPRMSPNGRRRHVSIKPDVRFTAQSRRRLSAIAVSALCQNRTLELVRSYWLRAALA